MVCNPCFCGCSLQTGTQIIAAIRMFFSGLNILLGIPLYMQGYIALQTAIVICVLGLVIFFISAVLYQGALERNAQKCLNWMYATIGIFLAQLVIQILYVVTATYRKTVVSIGAPGFIWDLYCILVVHCFVNQLQRVNDDPEADEYSDRY